MLKPETGFLKNREKWEIPLLFVLVTAVVLPVFWPFLTGRQYLLYNDVGGDTMTQYYPIYHKLAAGIRNGNFSLYNFSLGAGASWINEQSILMDPFAWITVLAGAVFGEETVAFALTVSSVLKLYAAAFLALAYLRKVKAPGGRIAASLLFAFSGYMLLWGQHFFLGTAPLFLLLVLIAAEDVLQDPSPAGHLKLGLACCATVLFSTYLGFMILLFAAGYFLLRLWYVTREKAKGTYARQLWPVVVTVVLGALGGAVLLMPSAERILASSRLGGLEDGETGSGLGRFFTLYRPSVIFSAASRMISNNLMGNAGWPGDLAPDNYYEMPQLFFSCFTAVTGCEWLALFVIREKNKKKRLRRLIPALLCGLLVILPIGAGLFNFFSDVRFRYTFVFLPLLAWMTALVWDKVFRQKEGSWIALAVGEAVSLAVVWLSARYISWRLHPLAWWIAAVLAAPGIFVLLLFLLGKMRQGWAGKAAALLKKAAPVLMLGLLVFDLLMEGETTVRWRNVITAEQMEQIEADCALTEKVLRGLEEKDPGVWRAEKMYMDFYYADPMLEDYLPAGGYNSVVSGGMRMFYRYLWPQGRVSESLQLFTEGQNASAASLLGVKYVLAKENIWASWLEKEDASDGILVYRNTNAPAMLRVFYGAVTEERALSLPEITRYQTVMNAVIGDRAAAEIPYESGKTPAATIGSIDTLDAARLTGRVKAEAEGFLVIALPYEPAWKVRVDGEPVSAFAADWGLIGVRVSAGEHTVELVYRNTLYLIGLAVSAVSLAGLFFWTAALRRKGNRR